MNTENVTYIHTMEYYSAIKKGWNLDICNNMDGPWGHYAKGTKSDRGRQIPHDLTYRWNIKEINKKRERENKLTDIENTLVAGGGFRVVEMGTGCQNFFSCKINKSRGHNAQYSGYS